MRIVEHYILRQTLVATAFVTLVLAALVFLTQSLRFLDLVMNAGASGLTIWLQTLLYLPGSFEIIIPFGLVAAVIFIYNRLTMDSELIVMRSLGFSPYRLAKPAIFLSLALGVFLFVVMGWLAPVSRAEAIIARNAVKAQMSSLIFREGIFNEAGPNLMVYIRDRDNKGELHGLIIHDTRAVDKPAATVVAGRGVLVSSQAGQQVLVFDGSRQEIDPETGVMRRLDFDRYTIDLPEKDNKDSARWKEPEERTLGELFSSALDKKNETREARRAFRVEIQKRFLVPFLVPGFTLIGLSLLLVGSHERRGQGQRVLIAIAIIVGLEVLFLGSYNLSKQSSVGLPLMLTTVSLPFLGSLASYFREQILSMRRRG